MDRQIVEELRDRQQDGIDLLIDRYHHLIYGILYKILYPRLTKEDIEECYNDIIFNIWNKIELYDEDKGSFRNWIISIIRFKAIDYVRKGKEISTQEVISLEKLAPIHGTSKLVEDMILEDENKERLSKLLNPLNEIDQTIFYLYYLDDVPIKEIARRLNLSTTSIYTRLSRGKKKLRKLKEVEENDV